MQCQKVKRVRSFPQCTAQANFRGKVVRDRVTLYCLQAHIWAYTFRVSQTMIVNMQLARNGKISPEEGTIDPFRGRAG